MRIVYQLALAQLLNEIKTSLRELYPIVRRYHDSMANDGLHTQGLRPWV
jgi:hypothetical protein